MIEAISRLRRFLGQTTSIPAKTLNRRRVALAVELLESRELLTLLPAPSSTLTQHPADNPTLPAAIQPFTPPVSVVNIDAAAPQLAALTQQGGPDDSLAATGFQFSTLTGSSAGQDTLFQVYGQTNATNGVLHDAAIQRLDGDRAVVTLDAGLPKNSMYLVWAENAAGAGLPFAVNKTEAWWIGPNAATPGKVVSIYGQNLSNVATSPGSWIYIQPSQGLGRWVTPTAVNPYKVDFVVPAGLAAGTYQVWVHNGRGGQYGWASPVTLTVQTQAPVNFKHLVVKLSDFGGLPNTGIDAGPALNAAKQYISSIGGPATIQLQAGTYYFSQDQNIVCGWGLGLYLQGAGKNRTFIKPLPGSNVISLGFNWTGAISDLTLHGAVSVCPSITNVAVISPFTNDVNGANFSGIVIKNSDFIGRGIYLTNVSQLFITGCNFYATNRTDSLLNLWSCTDVSVTHCTAQDFKVNSTNPEDHGMGRFFTGSAIWGTESNVYIGDNKTINFSQPATYGDQNTGEQIMWEGSQGLQSSMTLVATSTTATLANLYRDLSGMEAVIVGGKGAGQHRTITSTDFGAGGTTLTLDSPWSVIPDATTRINIVTTLMQVVVYRNKLDGNSNLQGATDNGQPGSASAAFEIFGGGFDVIVERNIISDFRNAINDFSYFYTGCTIPAFFNLYQNNTIINCVYGIRSFDSGNAVGELATHIGNSYRYNTMTRVKQAGWLVDCSTGQTMDLDIFEHNRVSDAPNGIAVWRASQPSVHIFVYKNTFNRGIAPLIGSKPIATQTGFDFGLSQNVFLNFLNPQNPKGIINARLPSFSWNDIPGTDHYDVTIRDITTGALVAQNIHLPTNSWTIPAALTVGHYYRWWVRSMGTVAPISNWSAGQTFYVAPLKPPLTSSPAGSIPVTVMSPLIPVLLTPIFAWSVVTNADTYQLRVDDLTTGQVGIIQEVTSDTSFASPFALQAGDRYQWSIRACRDDGNESSWSAVKFTFTFLVPVTNGPSGTTIDAKPTFAWERVTGAHHYDVMVADLTTGQSPVLRAPLTGTQIVTDTSWTASHSLTPGHNFRWWVRAINVNGVAGPWSPGVTFKVAQLTAPVLTSPIGTAQGSGFYFNWEAVAGADSYDFILIDITNNNSLVLRNTQVMSTSLRSPDLIAGHSYRWRVRSLSDSGNYSPWSSPADFVAT